MNATITTQSDKVLKFVITAQFSNLLDEMEIIYKETLVFKRTKNNFDIESRDGKCFISIPKSGFDIAYALSKLLAPRIWEILNNPSTLDSFTNALKYFETQGIWKNGLEIAEVNKTSNVSFTMSSSLFNFLYNNTSELTETLKKVFFTGVTLSLCNTTQSEFYMENGLIQFWINKGDCDKVITLNSSLHPDNLQLFMDTLKMIEINWNSIVEASKSLNITL